MHNRNEQEAQNPLNNDILENPNVDQIANNNTINNQNAKIFFNFETPYVKVDIFNNSNQVFVNTISALVYCWNMIKGPSIEKKEFYIHPYVERELRIQIRNKNINYIQFDIDIQFYFIF